jgi:hypothetical protein
VVSNRDVWRKNNAGCVFCATPVRRVEVKVKVESLERQVEVEGFDL